MAPGPDATALLAETFDPSEFRVVDSDEFVPDTLVAQHRDDMSRRALRRGANGRPVSCSPFIPEQPTRE